MQSRAGCRGFTATEVIVTAALIGVMGLIAVKPVKGFIQRIRLQNTVEGVKHFMLTARSRAVSNPMQRCGVVFDVSSNPKKVFAYLDKSNPPNNTYESGTDALYLNPFVLKAETGVQMTIPTSPVAYPGSIAFRGDGSANASARVVFTLGNLSATLDMLASTGRVKVIP